LREKNLQVVQMDGDRFRKVLGQDLGFTQHDRAENLRRAGAMAQLLVEAGTNVVAAFVSPYQADRQRIRELFPKGSFAEVFVRCPLGVCESRDPKGLYVRARDGRIPNFTGISDPYEEPGSPELVLDTNLSSVDECLAELERLVCRLQNYALESNEPE